MRRFAVPLLIVGSTALLAVLAIMWRAIDADSEPPIASATPHETAPQTSPAPAMPPMRPNARVPLPIAVRRSAERTPAATGAEQPPPSIEEGSGPPGTRLNTKNLHYGMAQMRTLVAANEPKVVECLTEAASRGHKPTGEATLTFIAAQRGDKVVIEETAVDYDKTTLRGEPLLECLHQTSSVLQFKGLPREADAVIVTRRVQVENGGLVDNSVLTFSYIR